MVKGARVVLTEPGVLKCVRAIDFMSVGEEEPEVAKGLVWDELKMGEGVWIGSWPREVGDEGSGGRSSVEGRPDRSGGVVEASWHC
jgi:hypothetical protein